jgi:hypothetical protein
MIAAGGEPFDDQLTRAFEINQPNIAASTDDLSPIGASQRRAGDYPVLSAATPLVDDCGNRRQPRLAIGISERLSAPHLGDVLGGVEVVAFLEFPAEPFCEAPLLPAPETPMTTATTETSGVGRTVHRSRLPGCIMLRTCPLVDGGGIFGCSTRIFEGSAKDRWPARCPTRRAAQRLEGDYQLAHSDQQSGIAG